MAGSSISTEALRRVAHGGWGPRGASRFRRVAGWLAGVAMLAILALAAAALIPGSHSTHTRFSTLAVAPHSSAANTLHVRQAQIFGSNIPAAKYRTELS